MEVVVSLAIYGSAVELMVLSGLSCRQPLLSALASCLNASLDYAANLLHIVLPLSNTWKTGIAMTQPPR
jgi:hypothetical protein